MNKKKDTLISRHDLSGGVKRVVIKIGSSVLTAGSDTLHNEVFENLAKDIAILKNANYEIILVSSGAVVTTGSP